MRKKVIINDTEYMLCTNALTMLSYKKEFGVGIMADISKLQGYNNKLEKVQKQCKEEGKDAKETEGVLTQTALEEFDDVIQVPLQLAYIFIKTGNKDFMDFESWLSTIEEINLDEKWIGEVTEIAVNTFCRQGTNRPAPITEK